MDLSRFKVSLSESAPPEGLSLALQALWHEAKGDWEQAHRLAQSGDGEDAAWVHAYLHRVEGDLNNAAYWYRRAGKPEETAPLDREWDTIAAALSKT